MAKRRSDASGALGAPAVAKHTPVVEKLAPGVAQRASVVGRGAPLVARGAAGGGTLAPAEGRPARVDEAEAAATAA